MNNTNTILDAMGELDNEILENAFRPKRKKPLILTVIAAAAALSLLVGFTAAERSRMEYRGEPVIDFNIKVHDDYVIPPIGEMVALGARDFLIQHEDSEFVKNNFDFNATDDYTIFKPEYAPGDEPPEDLPFDILNDYEAGYFYAIDNFSPSTVIEKYGFKSYINGNFTENVSLDDFPPEVYTREDFKEAITLMKLYPMHVDVTENCIYTRFWLIDNESGLPVYIAINHYIAESDEPVVSYHSTCSGKHEVITLNDGSKAMLEMSGFITGDEHPSAYTEFTYNGDLYAMSCPVDIDGMKRIIKNFGFIDE